MRDGVTAEQEVKLRASYDVKRRFLIERGHIPEDGTPTRNELAEIIRDLDEDVREDLDAKMDEVMERIDVILDGERKSFDEPHIEHEDLIDGVRIPGYYDSE